ncbi:MAG: hypothetical protein AAB445_03895 [Patescibacteria group bacterium]
MKKIIIVISAFLFGVLAVTLVFSPTKLPGLMLATSAVGALLLFTTWPKWHAKPTVTPSAVPNNELNRIYILVLVGATVLLMFDVFTQSSPHAYFPLVMGIIFVAGFATTAIKQKYTLVEYLTLKARDEREQYLIDTTSRRAYACIRLLGLLVAVLLLSGVFKNFHFNATNVAYLILALVFLTQLYFMVALRKNAK